MFECRFCVPAGSRVHDSLACLLSKSCLEVLAIMLTQEVPCYRLAAILVDSLEDLVTRSIAQAREEGEELPSEWRASLVFEDDLVQVAHTADLWHRSVSMVSDGIGRLLLLCPGCSSIASQWYRPVDIVSVEIQCAMQNWMQTNGMEDSQLSNAGRSCGSSS